MQIHFKAKKTEFLNSHSRNIKEVSNRQGLASNKRAALGSLSIDR
jgi:hypothetical protein